MASQASPLRNVAPVFVQANALATELTLWLAEHPRPSNVLLLALIGVLLECCEAADDARPGVDPEKLRAAMKRMAAELSALAETKPGDMRRVAELLADARRRPGGGE